MEGVAGVITGDDVAQATKPFSVGVTRADPLLLHGHGQGALRRRAGGGGRRARPLPGRGRRRAGRASTTSRCPPWSIPSARSSPTRPCCTRRSARTSPATAGSCTAIPTARSRSADVVIRERFRFPKYGSTPIETYGVIARWDPARRRAARSGRTSWGRSSCTRSSRRVLGLPENKLRFIVPPDIGGSFGIKSSIYPVHRADRARRDEDRRAGEVDRGPPRAPARLVERHRPRRLSRAGRPRRRHRSSACASAGSTTWAATSGAPSPAAASARPATSSGPTASRTWRSTPRW